MTSHLQDIEDYLKSGEPFAVISLPVSDDQPRKFNFFAVGESGEFIDEKGSQLILSPFEDDSESLPQHETTRQEHARMVQLAIDAIRDHEMDKVVISRLIRTPRNKNSKMRELMLKLGEMYPRAMVFVIQHDKYGAWIGATPELLFTKREKEFCTIALAGTQPVSPNGEYVWNPKLLHEQRMVTGFIAEAIELLNARNISMKGPVSSVAGPIVHLKTDISFTSDSESKQVAAILHPTPAVCGLPRQQSYSFIAKNELHQRRMYTGMIGIQHSNDNADYYVGLRCMQIFPDHFELFVGGGITGESDPDSEWMETEHKSSVLLNAIREIDSKI